MSQSISIPLKRRSRADEQQLVGWAILSKDLLLRVFARLSDAVDIVVAGEVNKHWHNISCTPQLWKRIDLSKRMHKNKLTDSRFLSLVGRAGGPLDSLRLHDAQMISYSLGIKPILSTFANLQRLSFKNLSVSYEGLIAIVQIPTSLTDLELNQSNVTDATLKSIADAPYASKLVSLNLRASTLITDDGIEVLIKSLKQVTQLDLSWCSELTGRSVELIVAALPALRSFNLRWCRKVPWSAILLIQNLRQLTHLNISHIAKGIAKLPDLDVRSMHELVQAIGRMKGLVQLDIAGLPFSTIPDQVNFISRSLPQLKDFSYRPENQKHGSSTAIQQQRRAAAEAAAAAAQQKELNEDEEADEVMQNIS